MVDAKGMYASAGAVLKGYLAYKAESGIKGVLFNKISPSIYEGLSAIAQEAGIKPLGFRPGKRKLLSKAGISD